MHPYNDTKLTRPATLATSLVRFLVMGVCLGGMLILALVGMGFLVATAIALIVMGFRLGWPF